MRELETSLQQFGEFVLKAQLVKEKVAPYCVRWVRRFLIKDEDFHRLALLRGAATKFIWIRLGNCTTEDIAQLLRRRHDDIIQFNEQNEATVLELG